LIPNLGAIDILISAFYVLLIYLISLYIRKKLAKPFKSYILPFVTYRLLFALAFVLIHVYYFKGGDTFVYFDLGKFFADQLRYQPSQLFDIYSANFESLRNLKIEDDYFSLFFLRSTDTRFMGKMMGIFNLLTGNHFLASTIVFSVCCSIGLWQIFTTVSSMYPKMRKFFAIGILYYPTIAIWSSGILKDPLAMLSIGLMFRATYLLCKRKRIIYSVFVIAISIFICQYVKPYILYLFIPSMFLWAHGLIAKQIKKTFIKVLISPLIVLSFILGVYFFTNQISDEAGKYSIENIEKVAKGFHSWHQHLADTRDQSGYTLGEVKFTPMGILQKAPEALFVTYFRPFPIIDTKNASTLFEGIQSFTLLMISLFVFFRLGPKRLVQYTLTNPHVRAFMVFALLFGFVVGFTSYNFGALSRYKIPALPFYTTSLCILYAEFLIKKQSRKRAPKPAFG